MASPSPPPSRHAYAPPCYNDRTSELVSAVERLNKAAAPWDSQATMGQQPIAAAYGIPPQPTGLQRTTSSLPVAGTNARLRRTASVNPRGADNSPRGSTSGSSGPSSPIRLGTIATFEAPGKPAARTETEAATATAVSAAAAADSPQGTTPQPPSANTSASTPAAGLSAAPASPARARAASAAPAPAAGDSAHHPQSELSRRASRIGLSIHQMMQKLHKLAKLSKRTSMFDDPTAEIQNLSALVSQDLSALGAAISGLQSFCEAQALSKEAGDSRQPSGGSAGAVAGNAAADAATRQRVELGMAVVESLRERLAKAGEEFKDVLATRSEALKVSENRRQLFSATAATGQSATAWHSKRPVVGGGTALLPTTSSSSSSLSLASSPSVSPSSSPSSTLPVYNPFGRNTTATAANSHTGPSSSSSSYSNGNGLLPCYSSPSPSASASAPSFAQHGSAQQHAHAASAHHAIALQQVESSMGELTAVFRDLAHTMAQQGGGQKADGAADLAICIDDGLSESLLQMQQAHRALLKDLDVTHSHRPLIIKSFLTLASFLFLLLAFSA
ncbi:hypothetical protein CLOP_g8509 [Closterium sp. NIES-67]|nr:hypothetical protein CLOP_g8509 [Closterium sp. NIES-67]